MKIVMQKIKIDGVKNLVEISCINGNTLVVEFYDWEGRQDSREYLVYTGDDERFAAKDLVEALVGPKRNERRGQIVDEIACAFAAMLG